MRKLFTSESVTEGHPDKLCDQVSDAVLDALLAQDPMSRVACETCATTGMVMVMPWLPLPELMTTGSEQPAIRASEPAAAQARAFSSRLGGFCRWTSATMILPSALTATPAPC